MILIIEIKTKLIEELIKTDIQTRRNLNLTLSFIMI